MYEGYYGFKEKPFSLLPDPAFFFMSEQHSAALSMLNYGLHNHAGFTVITGGVGCGKSTLIHYLIDQLHQDITLGLITNPHKSFGDLLQWVLLAFGLEYSGRETIDRYQTFTKFLAKEHAKKRRCLLVVDEAQNLGVEALEELRMLSNVNAGKGHLLQLILLGQPQLLEFLRRRELYQFAQRIVADYFIGPLNLSETCAYIRHRVSAAGGPLPLFLRAACDPIYRYGKGNPRLTNLICDTALVYGYAAREQTITAELVNEAVRDMLKGRRINRHRREAGEARPANGSAVYRPTARFRETMLFDLNGVPDLERQETSFSRLPKGETVEVDLEEGHAVDLLLVKHQCRILLRDRLLFVDESGRDSELRVGRNVVGRDAVNDVVIDDNLRDVSRKHLIVESDGVGQIKLTDISSHGTSLPLREPRRLTQ